MQDKYLNDKFDAIRHAAINISIIDNERKLNSAEKIVEAIKRYGCGAAELELKEYIESLTPQTPWTEIEKKFAQDKFGQETGYWSRIHINFLKMGYDEQHYQTATQSSAAGQGQCAGFGGPGPHRVQESHEDEGKDEGDDEGPNVEKDVLLAVGGEEVVSVAFSPLRVGIRQEVVENA